LTASAGFAAWVEFLLLRRWLSQRIGHVPVPGKLGLACLAGALVAGAAGYGANVWVGSISAHTWPRCIAAIAAFGIVYLTVMSIAKIPEAGAFTGRITRRFRRAR
jgi:hypothetical protein